MGRQRRLRQIAKRAATLAATLAVLVTNTSAAAENMRELEVRAAMIFNFARFARWPENAFKRSEKTITICTNEESDLYTSLKELQGKRVHGKSVSVKALQFSATDASPCHVVVLTEAAAAPGVDYQFGNALVISTVQGAAPKNATIELVSIGRQTRFVINLSAAKANGVELSSKLIDLAIRVR